MNFYPFHIGDYASATRHLTWDEDAAYRRMLDVYYTSEAPLPADTKKICRLVVATTKVQRDAVQSVLNDFFECTDAGWVNRRADAEIAAMREKQSGKEEKGAHERDRMKRHRERRASMFEALRAVGIVPKWDTPTSDLQQMFDTHCTEPATPPVTGLQREQVVSGDAPATAIPIPIPLPIPIPIPNTERALLSAQAPETPQTRPEGTTAGQVCKAMRGAGLQDANPSHPKLAALLQAGVTPEELADAAKDAVGKGKGFAYALATAEGRRRDVAAMVALPASAPVDPDSRTAIEAEGIAKGIGPWNELHEHWPAYKARVRGAAPQGFAPSIVGMVSGALRKEAA